MPNRICTAAASPAILNRLIRVWELSLTFWYAAPWAPRQFGLIGTDARHVAMLWNGMTLALRFFSERRLLRNNPCIERPKDEFVEELLC